MIKGLCFVYSLRHVHFCTVILRLDFIGGCGCICYRNFGLSRFRVKRVLVLVLFFVTSSFFSKYKKEVKKRRRKTEKETAGIGGKWRRTAELRSGGNRAFLTGEELWLFIFSVSACANADT